MLNGVNKINSNKTRSQQDSPINTRQKNDAMSRQSLLKSCISSTLTTPDVSSLISAISIMIVHEIRLTVLLPVDDLTAVPSQPQPIVLEGLAQVPTSFGVLTPPNQRHRNKMLIPKKCGHNLHNPVCDMQINEKRDKFFEHLKVFEQLGMKDFEGSVLFTHRVPNVWEVMVFLKELYRIIHWTPECFVLAIVYLGRVLSNPYGFTLSTLTWSNVEFVTGYAKHTYLEANLAERTFLKMIDYEVGVRPSTYALGYFGCHTAAKLFEESIMKTRRLNRKNSSLLDLTDEEAIEYGAKLLNAVERYQKHPVSQQEKLCKLCYRCTCKECQNILENACNAKMITGRGGQKHPIKKSEKKVSESKWLPKAIFNKITTSLKMNQHKLVPEEICFETEPVTSTHRSIILSAILPCAYMGHRLDNFDLKNSIPAEPLKTSTKLSQTNDIEHHTPQLNLSLSESSSESSSLLDRYTQSMPVSNTKTSPNGTHDCTESHRKSSSSMKNIQTRKSVSFDSLASLKREIKLDENPWQGGWKEEWKDDLPLSEIDVMDPNYEIHFPENLVESFITESQLRKEGHKEPKNDMIINQLGHGRTSELLTLHSVETTKKSSIESNRP